MTSTLDLIEIALARISGETQTSVGKRMNLCRVMIATIESNIEYQEIRQKLTDMIIDESARLFVQEHMSQAIQNVQMQDFYTKGIGGLEGFSSRDLEVINGTESSIHV